MYNFNLTEKCKIICKVIFALIDYTYTAVNNCTSMKIIHSIKVIKV